MPDIRWQADHFPTVLFEDGQVILNDRIFIHGSVHGRRQKLRAFAGQDGGGEHVIGNAVSKLSNDIGGSRGNQYQIRFFCYGNMFHLESEIPVKGIDETFISSERFKGHRCDKLRCISGHNDLHIAVLLFQGTG